jgi:hypothetical protein
MKGLNERCLKREKKGSMRRSDNTALAADEDFDAGWTGIALREYLDCARLRVDLEMNRGKNEGCKTKRSNGR